MSDYEPKCKKTLPIIFDDRMPVNNLTPKLVGRVNDNTEDLKNLYEETETIQGDIESLQEDVDDKLDIPETAGTAGQVLTSDGEGGAVWASVGSGEIVVDPTLTVEGAAADAKKTGDEITHLKQDNIELQKALGNSISGSMTTGYYIHKANGGRNSNASYAYCDYFAVIPGSKIKLKHVAIYSTQGTAFYDANKNYVGYVESATTGGDLTVETTVPDGAYYLRATALVANTVIIEVLDLYTQHIVPLEGYVPSIVTNSRTVSVIRQSAVTDIKQILPFVVGTLNGSTGAINYSNKYRISTTFVTAEMDLCVSVASGYRFFVVSYLDEVYYDSGWKTEYIIPKGTLFAISVGITPESASYVVTDIYTDGMYTNLSVEPLELSANGFWITKYRKPLALSVEEINATYTWTQGACTVGNKILGFKSSANDHTSTNDVYIYNASNMSYVGVMQHNLGHCATADYNAEVDVLLTGNGDTDMTIVPAVWFMKNAAGKISGDGTLLVTDPDAFSITFNGIDGHGCGACFGESSDFIYVLTSENPANPSDYKAKYLYKVMLGKGTNDFSSGGYGTYKSGVSANEYNGTAKIVNTYTFDLPGEIQGLKFRNGNLFLSTDTSIINNVLTGYIAVFTVTSDILLKNVYEIPRYSNGARIRTEAEGVTFYEDHGYIAVIHSETRKLLRFPIGTI